MNKIWTFSLKINELIYKPGSVLIAEETIIHLAYVLLHMSCDLPVNSNEQFSNIHSIAIACNFLILLKSGVYIATAITCNAGGLLHHRFTPYQNFFWRFTLCCTVPAGHPGWMLSTTLLFRARTFLCINCFTQRLPDQLD